MLFVTQHSSFDLCRSALTSIAPRNNTWREARQFVSAVLKKFSSCWTTRTGSDVSISCWSSEAKPPWWGWGTWAWEEDHDNFAVNWGAWTDLIWHQGVRRRLERTVSGSNWTRNSEGACLLWGDPEEEFFVSVEFSARFLQVIFRGFGDHQPCC